MPENPYESPQAEANSVNPITNRVLTENMLFYLRAASPWLRFIGIVGFVSLGLMAVYFIAISILINSAINSAAESIPGFGVLGSSFVLVMLLIMEGILFFPTFFIFQFGRKLRAYLHSGENSDLEQAFKHNKSLWTFLGVLSIISLAFTAIGVLTMVGTIIASTALF
jgi:hypothetical protein